ncbi:hypothetical protein GCM10011502_24510 [Oceanisphaera marina]|uniref:Uncharacterized protein n=1 Tax=Oceanisphaera marina TaxID=2017550 RepID=A0ABQ1IR54_9GAMM|nr:hypothetical protein GCM10011502_24510 [Oceanisphaera marina]
MGQNKVFPKPAVNGMDAIAEYTGRYLLRVDVGYLILTGTQAEQDAALCNPEATKNPRRSNHESLSFISGHR